MACVSVVDAHGSTSGACTQLTRICWGYHCNFAHAKLAGSGPVLRNLDECRDSPIRSFVLRDIPKIPKRMETDQPNRTYYLKHCLQKTDKDIWHLQWHLQYQAPRYTILPLPIAQCSNVRPHVAKIFQVFFGVWHMFTGYALTSYHQLEVLINLRRRLWNLPLLRSECLVVTNGLMRSVS